MARMRIRKADVLIITGMTEKELDTRRKVAASDNKPIDVFDSAINVDYFPNGNAGFYVLDGEESAIFAFAETKGVMLYDMSGKPIARDLTPETASA